MSDEIILAPYDSRWAQSFASARDELLALLSDPPLQIHHVGSTAVPGLWAKPVIDIIVLVGAMPPVMSQMSTLETAGYEFRPEVSGPQRLFLRRHGRDGVRTHHLHVHTDAEEVRRHLIFRDALRADAVVRQAYLALKHDLAARHHADREAYAKGKDAFVDRVVLEAGGPARQPFWNA